MKQVNVLKLPEIYKLYSELKYEPKFKSLDMSEKLYMLQRIGETWLSYKEARREFPLSAEFVLDNINARGFSRTRKILEFAEQMQLKLRETNLEDEKVREDFKAEMKKKIFDA